MLVVAAVHGAGALTGLPEGILFARHGPQLVEHFLSAPAHFGEDPVDRKPIGVRKLAHENCSF